MANLQRVDEPVSIHANQLLGVVAGFDRGDRSHRTCRARRPTTRRLRVSEDGEDHELSIDGRTVSIDVDQQAVVALWAALAADVRWNHLT
jgi:hypothetical protein